jgi:hypothetical protein
MHYVYISYISTYKFNKFHFLGVGCVYIGVRYEVFTAVTMKNVVSWDVTPCVALVRTDVSVASYC